MKVRNNFNPKLVENKVRAAIGVLSDTASKKMEKEAKINALWQDRTTNARNSIQGDSGWEGNKCKIVLSGNMEYSVCLELANEKKYAILKPTIERNAPEVLRAYRKLVG